ncbi:MAG: HU family DNA-binding protein [Armatimonadota bacterium]
MTKTDLVEAMAEDSGLTKADAERALAAFVKVVSEALSRGQSVQLTGFGTFEPRQRAARKGRNLYTGEEMHVPAAVVPAFRAGKALKDVVR